jgi:uncharacterized coiled-coil protein SlyX
MAEKKAEVPQPPTPPLKNSDVPPAPLFQMPSNARIGNGSGLISHYYQGTNDEDLNARYGVWNEKTAFRKTALYIDKLENRLVELEKKLALMEKQLDLTTRQTDLNKSNLQFLTDLISDRLKKKR